MKLLSKSTIIAAVLCFLGLMPPGAHYALAQDDVIQPKEIQNVNRAPYVFIDCDFCDFNHIRSEIRFVNYVRDQAQADIHVFMTQTGLTSGGTEYELSFIGLNQFSRINFDLKHTATYDDTWAEIRDDLNSVIKSALVPFISQTPLSSKVELNIAPINGDFEE